MDITRPLWRNADDQDTHDDMITQEGIEHYNREEEDSDFVVALLQGRGQLHQHHPLPYLY